MGLVEKSEFPIFLMTSARTSSFSLKIFKICSFIVDFAFPKNIAYNLIINPVVRNFRTVQNSLKLVLIFVVLFSLWVFLSFVLALKIHAFLCCSYLFISIIFDNSVILRPID